MAKLDSQMRLLVPMELTTEITLRGKIAICWDTEEKTIYLDQMRENQYCIGIRNFEAKNRIVLSKNVLQLIGASRTSEFIVALRKHRIYIMKKGEDKEEK